MSYSHASRCLCQAVSKIKIVHCMFGHYQRKALHPCFSSWHSAVGTLHTVKSEVGLEESLALDRGRIGIYLFCAQMEGLVHFHRLCILNCYSKNMTVSIL